MQTSKPALASRGLWIILAITLCIGIGIGIITGFFGGLHNEAGAIYHSSAGSRAIGGREVIRL